MNVSVSTGEHSYVGNGSYNYYIEYTQRHTMRHVSKAKAIHRLFFFFFSNSYLALLPSYNILMKKKRKTLCFFFNNPPQAWDCVSYYVRVTSTVTTPTYAHLSQCCILNMIDTIRVRRVRTHGTSKSFFLVPLFHLLFLLQPCRSLIVNPPYRVHPSWFNFL